MYSPRYMEATESYEMKNYNPDEDNNSTFIRNIAKHTMKNKIKKIKKWKQKIKNKNKNLKDYLNSPTQNNDDLVILHQKSREIQEFHNRRIVLRRRKYSNF